MTDRGRTQEELERERREHGFHDGDGTGEHHGDRLVAGGHREEQDHADDARDRDGDGIADSAQERTQPTGLYGEPNDELASRHERIDDDQARQQHNDQHNDHHAEQPDDQHGGPHGDPDRTHPYLQHDNDDRDELHVPSQRTPEGQGEAGDILIASDAPTQPAPPPAAHTAQPFELFDQDPVQLHERWREVQAGFVDEPREAVERADQLVDEVVTALTNTLGSRTSELRNRWQNSSENDTEQLRLALRDYRAVLERLVSLAGREGR
ncbi:hypothetical protein [Nonomuraea sp. NPDC050310]|uniref:hypothetical protein n=1 Tax=Nonomuraea sp. NPDC050310 TaxID=3154935 RepID=UPI003402AD49